MYPIRIRWYPLTYFKGEFTVFQRERVRRRKRNFVFFLVPLSRCDTTL